MKVFRIPLPINLYPFCMFESLEPAMLQEKWLRVKIMKSFSLKKVNEKIINSINDLKEIFKLAKIKKNEMMGCFSIYLLREIKILYKIKIFLNKQGSIDQMKIMLGFHLTLNHSFEVEEEFLYFVMNSIFCNIFGVFAWKDNNVESQDLDSDS